LLYSELFGWTDDLGDYVHLSDGGHFENLGIYELVRRRCRYIVAVEAPADPSAATDSLANMIRLCRIDFGVRIDLDTNPLERTGTQSLSQWHCAIGIIHYEDVDGGELPGILVYIRASLTGDEPPDVQEYAAKNPAFPFQSTLDQFFNETQFESYRALGYHAATHVFKDALRDIGVLFPDRAVFDTDEAFIQENRALFAELRRRWFPPIPDPDRAIDQASKDWLEVQKQFSDKPALKDLAAELVPELGSFLRPAKVAKGDLGANNGKGYGAEPEETHPDHREIVELATVGQMLQVMENAWIALKMETRSDHPMNRGWMNVFRRWTGSDTFQQLWPFFRGQFNRDFIDFCEDQLRLQSGQTRHVRTVDLAADVRERAIAFLVHAFDREWPSDPSRSADGKATPRWIKSGLGGLIEDAGRLGLASPAAWLITQDIAIPRSCREQFPCGIVLARNDSFTAGMYELFVWILPAYRGLGIGRRHLGAILKSLTRELVERASGEPVSYHVRFPSSGFERDVKETLWLSFFYHYDFRPADRHKHRPGDDLLLKAHFTYNELADRLQSRRSR
jgi:GNAT superfamily N-acetyltransferase